MYKFYLLHDEKEYDFKYELCSFEEKPSFDVFLTYLEWEYSDLKECCIDKIRKWFDDNFHNEKITLSNGMILIVEEET